MPNSTDEIVNELIQLLATAGTAEYHGEDVSQLEHALQAAQLAQDAGRVDVEVIAALLHDIGHIWPMDGHAVTDVGVVDHDTVGERVLGDLGFSDAVTEIVSGHVEAKRYLVAERPEYAARLSETSIESLRLQGGPMSPEEAESFSRAPWFEEKLRLRVWDDLAKVPGARVSVLESYREMLTAHLRAATAAAQTDE